MATIHPSDLLSDGIPSQFHFGELFPRVGFIVTNLETDSRAVVRFYNKRGTAEQWIKEGKQAVKMTRLSCHRFRSNEVRLMLSLISLQPVEPVATTGAAEEDRELVPDEFAAKAGENGRAAGETRTVLLAAAGGKPSDAAVEIGWAGGFFCGFGLPRTGKNGSSCGQRGWAMMKFR